MHRVHRKLSVLPLLGGLLLGALGCTEASGAEDEDASTERPDGSTVDGGRFDMDPYATVCDLGDCFAPRCRTLDYYDGEAEEGLVIGEYDDGFTPWTPGGDATYEFGFQGGVMVRPIVQVPAEAVGDERCAVITVRHRPDPAYPDDAGELDFFEENVFTEVLRPGTDVFSSPALYDQMGWGSPDGVRMIVQAEVRGVDYAYRTGELPVRVVDADGWDECDVVPTAEMFGCTTHVFENGTLHVDAVGDTTGLACDDPVDVTVTYEPADVSVPEGCVELTRTLQVERGCVEAQEVVAGSDREGRWMSEEVPDTCGNELGLVLTGCDCE
ncbi:MAG: hypothetical protein CMN30_05175 [Sandaracinus sp.]|nr:hypothetical protein [Sandaracinus sp.]|tara:strand:+ start:828 stop:1805 length:978 start_codon:yes stop_codon:yes gene_type:complete